MKTKSTFAMQEGTLAELRAIVEQAAAWPGDAVVRVRTRAELNADGGRARSVTLVAAKG